MATMAMAIALLGVLLPLMALFIALFALNVYDYRMSAVQTLNTQWLSACTFE